MGTVDRNMMKLTIDNLEVEVQEGATILDAARQCGVHIPTLCFLDGHAAPTSCLVCAVRVNAAARLVPACATRAVEGMAVESETADVRAARKLALELLLGDHAGDCLAPCQIACPAHLDIPEMLRHIAAEHWPRAIAVIKETIPLPATLGRICPGLCERGCRRAQHDAAVAICRLKWAAADVDLASSIPYMPPCAPENGRTVAIIGAGPAGLSAAYFLQRAGCACTIYDEGELPGGTLRTAIAEDVLPQAVLAAEIAGIAQLGVRMISGTRIGRELTLDAVRADCDAVVLACGSQPASGSAQFAGIIGARGHTCTLPGVFHSGAPTKYAVQAVAAGDSVARAVLAYLKIPFAEESRFSVHLGRLGEEELRLLLPDANPAPRVTPAKGEIACISMAQACDEAARCLHCDCRKLQACKLRQYAMEYGAQPARFKGTRRELELDRTHADLVYEPGKCIACGLCVQIAAEAREALGLSFIGRGFTVRVAAPFGENMAAGLREVGLACADACPTGALALK